MSFNTNDKFNTLSGTLLQTTTISASAISASSIVGPVSATAAGANTQIQFNDSGSFGATGSFTYNKNQENLRVGNIQGLDSNTYLTIKAPAGGEFSGIYLTGATHTLVTDVNDSITAGNQVIELSTSGQISNLANNISTKNYHNVQKYPETVYISSDPGYNPYYPELFRIATSYVGAAPSTTASIGDGLMVSEFGDVGNSKLYVEGYITSSVGVSSSLAKFTTITASVISASSYLGITGGGGTPGGTSGQIQYNSAGTFAGTSGLTYSGTTLSGTTAILPTLTSSQEAIYTTNNMGVSTAGGIAATTKTGSIAVQATDANGLFFHPSGTYMYVADNTTDKVYEYSLSTPWDVSTISYTSVTASFGSEENTPHDIFFHPSGTYFYVLGTNGDDINQYSMSPAWSLGSAVFVASSSANFYEGAPLGMWFKPDGTSVYIVGSVTNTVRQHSITTPWDITTMVTASVVSSYNALTAITNGQVSGISFSDDGKKMYLISSAAGDRRMYEFYLSTAWNVSTVTKYIQHNIANANNTITSTSVLSALYRRSDGSNIYFINNGSVDKVIQYDTKNASLSIGDGILQVNDGLAVFGSSSFGDLMANNIRSTALTTIAGIGVGTGITAGTTISASSTIQAGGAITGAAGMSISGGPTTIAGGAGQNLTVSTTAIFSGPNANFGSNTVVSGSIAKFDTVIGKYATYTANFTVPTASYFLGISSTGSVITASLTGAASYYAGQTLIFKDIGGSSSVNNILIKPSGSDTIDGATGGAIIATPSGSITMVANGTNGFYIIGMV